MHRVRLVHWNVQEAEKKAQLLQSAGYVVDRAPLNSPEALKQLRADPPTAVVIDLNRIPSHGREIALALRQYKSSRHIPLLFVDGEPEKVAPIQQVLPDAQYTTWSRIRSALKHAIAHPPTEPRVPTSVFEGYSGTPLPKKLGIKPNSLVALIGAPPDFADTLGELPADAKLVMSRNGKADLTLWFIRSRRELEKKIDTMAAKISPGGLWIIWPKKASALAADVGEADVRKMGLAAGLVDYKVCAVDATWSGLKFARRSERTPR